MIADLTQVSRPIMWNIQAAGAMYTLFGVALKDVSTSMTLGKEMGAAMFTASVAYEVFHAGKPPFPGEGNRVIVKLFEQIAGTEVKKQYPRKWQGFSASVTIPGSGG